MKSVHLAGPGDTNKLVPLVVAFHEEKGFGSTEDLIHDAVMPLLEGSPHGAIWLIGPRIAPVGYICVSFGWSLELGGLDGMVDEFYIRKAVRGRGMGTEALITLMKALQSSGVRALSLEVDRQNARVQGLYQRAGFDLRADYALMTHVF